MRFLGLILFDIDGVLRDVGSSYRLAVKKTVLHFCGNEPTNEEIDNLKNEGIWNNDWDLSLELIKRNINLKDLNIKVPKRLQIIKLFEKLYFGCNPNQDYSKWSGFINNEKLLVDNDLFQELSRNRIGWGFVSGAEQPSAKFVLEKRLKINNPQLIAMGDAPEKPNPEGLILLSKRILKKELGANTPPIAFVGDTVADVMTVVNARQQIRDQRFISLAVSPPHLHANASSNARYIYESKLKEAGADYILQSVNDIKFNCKEFLSKSSRSTN